MQVAWKTTVQCEGCGRIETAPCPVTEDGSYFPAVPAGWITGAPRSDQTVYIEVKDIYGTWFREFCTDCSSLPMIQLIAKVSDRLAARRGDSEGPQ